MRSGGKGERGEEKRGGKRRKEEERGVEEYLNG